MEEKELTLADRVQGAIWGQFIGDAAALGTHWIYDLDEMHRLYPAIAGFEAPGEAHYHFGKQPGDQTHYGDAALLLLESIAECGTFDLSDFARRFVKLFGSASYHGYRDHATRETLHNLEAQPENLQNGADDEEPATVTRLAPLVAAFQGHPDLLNRVAELTRFCQNNTLAVDYSKGCAQLLEALLHGLGQKEALQAVTNPVCRKKIQAVRDLKASSVLEATRLFGQSCPLEKSFPASVFALMHSGPDFRTTILEILAAGGDNAARAAMVGMWLGAMNGIEAIPEDWRNRLTAKERIANGIEAILNG